MTPKRLSDAVSVAGTRRTTDGYLVVEAYAARSGIQLYNASELGLADRDDVVRVYRPEDEVRDPHSLSTFSHAPVTLGHPTENVTKDNWKDLAKGEVSTEATWDGNKIKLPLIIKDAAAIAAIESGVRELSAGYNCALHFQDGVTPAGEPYDAIQRHIKINHLAIVPKGRAGSECRIGDADARWGASPIIFDRKDDDMADAITTRTVLIDGLSVETTDAGAQALEKLQGVIADKDKVIADVKKDKEEAIAEKDKEIGKKDAEIDDLKGKVLDAKALDAMVAKRASLVQSAKAIANDVKTEGLSDAEIRKAVVAAKLGDEVVADRSDDYIESRFDHLAGSIEKKDKVADTIKDGLLTRTNDGWDAVVPMRKEA